MKAPWIPLVTVCLAMSPIASAQFETNLQRINRENNARQWANARAEMRRQIDAFNVEITAAREQFWATYPDKPGAPEAQKKFFDLLLQKDEFYVTSVLSNRMSTGGDPTDSLDDGIRSTAQPEFDDFIEAARPGIAMQSGDMMKMMQTVWAAIDMHPNEFRAYRLERNYWEFYEMHRIPAQWDTPEKYPIYLYVRYYHLTIGDAEKSVASMFTVLGKDVITAAARQVMDAPKSDKGNIILTSPRPVKIGPGGSEVEDTSAPEPANPVGAYSSPILTFGKLLSKDDDRRYLLYLLSNQHRIDSTKMDRVTQWPFAATTYARLVIAFGEKDVLAAAHQVRMATKRYAGGMVMHPDAIGATREEPFDSFGEILARSNPPGYLRSVVAFAYSLDSAAAIDSAYQKLVADVQEEAYLTAARRRIKNGPSVIYPQEIRSLQAYLNAAPEVVKAPEEMVDSPAYLDWKRFSAGARITYHERKWMASRPRPGSYVSDDPSRLVAYPPDSIVSYQLQSIDAKRASLWLTQSSANAYGQMHPGSDSEISYLAKYPKSAADRNAAAALSANNGPTAISTMAWNPKRTSDPVESGDEIVEVKGHRIATHWQSAKYTADDAGYEQGITLTVKVWTSDAVPTGLVRRTEDKVAQHIPGQLVPARYIVETYLESFDGFTPTPATGSGPVMTAYTPPSNPAATPPARTTPAASSPTPAASPFSAPAKPTPMGAQPTPRPTHSAPPAPTLDTSKMSPEMARQVESGQKYTAVTTRASRARSQLMQWQQIHGASAVSAEVAAARDNIPAQLQAAIIAMMNSPNGPQAAQALQTLNASSSAIEKFLGN